MLFSKYYEKSKLKNVDVYISSYDFYPRELNIYRNIQFYTFLYDIMPVNYPEYYPNYFITKNIINEYAKMKNINQKYFYFCISNCTKNDYLKYYSSIIDINKIYVTYIASAQKYFPIYNLKKLSIILKKYNVIYKNNKYLFSLCTLEPRKNLIFTIKCFIKFILKNNINDLYFYLAGTHWEHFMYKLEEYIEDINNYQDKIIKLGYIDDEDVNILYSNSLFFTYISQYEGFGMPPLEAMQAGTAVITSNNSSLPEVVGDAAIMIDYDNEEQCIKAFEDLYYNEDLRKYYIEKGIERSKLFSWKKTSDNIADKIIININEK